jgi:hypothetical protein
VIESTLRSALLAAAPVVALVVDRISPQPMPQGETLPCVTVKKISDQPMARGQRGPSGLLDARIQVDAWGATLLAAQTVADAVVGVLDPRNRRARGGINIPLYVGNGSRIDWARMLNQQDFDESDVQDAGDPAIRYHRVSTDFLVRYARES